MLLCLYLSVSKYLRYNIPKKELRIFYLNHVCFPKKSIPTYARVIYPGPSFSCTFYIWSNTRPRWLYLCTDIAWSEPILPHLWENWESWVRWSLSTSWLWHCATTHWWSSSFTHSPLLTLSLSSLRVYYNFWIHPEPGPRNPCSSLSYWDNTGPSKAASGLNLIANPVPSEDSYPSRWGRRGGG